MADNIVIIFAILAVILLIYFWYKQRGDPDDEPKKFDIKKTVDDLNSLQADLVAEIE